MSKYKKRRHSSGGYSPPPKKGNTGAKIVKGIAIVMAAFAGISLLSTLLPARHTEDNTPTEPAQNNVSYSWGECSYYWPLNRTVSDGYLTITQSQGSGATTANCQQFFVMATEGNSVSLPEWTDFTVDATFKLADYTSRTDFSIMGRLQHNDDDGFTYYEIVFRNDAEFVALRKVTQDRSGSKSAELLAKSEAVFTRDQFHDVRVSFAGDTIMIFVDNLTTHVLAYKDADPLVSGTVGVDLARLGIATVDYIKVCDSDNVLFTDDFTDSRYFPAESSEATE